MVKAGLHPIDLFQFLNGTIGVKNSFLKLNRHGLFQFLNGTIGVLSK